jgi:hypothetical protein
MDVQFISNEREDKSMSWFGNKDDALKSRDWSTYRATRVDNGAIGSGSKVETHVRNDGRYLVEKDQNGRVLSVKRIS